MQSILKYDQVDLSKVVYDEFVESSDKQFVVSKMWYQKDETSRPQTFYVQTQKLKIDELNPGNILAIVDNSSLYSQLDKKSLDVAKSKNVSKKFGLKGLKYKPMVTEINASEDKNFDALSLSIFGGSSGTPPTKFFVGTDKSAKSFEDVKSMLKLGTSLKAILEVDGLTIDTKHNIIYTNVILRQVLVPVVLPLRLELPEYSFIDSDNEEEQLKPTTDAVVVNTHTEHTNQESEKEEKKEKKDKKTKPLPKSLPTPSPSSSSSSEEEQYESDNSESDDANTSSGSSHNDTSDDEEDVKNFLKTFTKK
jgi:hypothetical protein